MKKVLFVLVSILTLFCGIFSAPMVMAEGPNTTEYYVYFDNSNEYVTISELVAYDPANPNSKENIPLGEKNYYPEGWHISARIEVKENNVLNTDSHALRYFKDQGFTITSEKTDAGKKSTYTLNAFELKENVDVYSLPTTFMNFATFKLNGGTWNESDQDEWKQIEDCCEYAYKSYIAPGTTVSKPNDPVRENYTFAGWKGESELSGENITFTADDPYQFAEEDPNKFLQYVRGRIVNLNATWVPVPTMSVKDITIEEGGSYSIEDFIENYQVYGVEGDPSFKNSVKSIDIIGNPDTSKPGTYSVQITLTDNVGGTVTTTANLIVEKKPEPEPQPEPKPEPEPERPEPEPERPEPQPERPEPELSHPTLPTSPEELSEIQIRVEPIPLSEVRPSQGQVSEVVENPSAPSETLASSGVSPNLPGQLPATGSVSPLASLALGLTLSFIGVIVRKRG